MSKIAMLGLGEMGTRVAQNLLDAGHSVIVYNRTLGRTNALVEQGAILSSTPRNAANQADVVISMVTDDEASRALWLDTEFGAVYGLQPGAIAIESSTLSVEWTKTLGTIVENQGTEFLDAPVVGSRPQAEARKLIYLVGGKRKTLSEVQNILLSTGVSVHYMGEIGQGMTMKLAVNGLFGIQVAAVAEMLTMLAKYDVDPEITLQILGELPVFSLAAKGAASLMTQNKHAPLFPIHLVEKDLSYLVNAAEDKESICPVTKAVRDIYRGAIAQDYGNDNITGVIQFFNQ